MCTLYWEQEPQRFRLLFNRDEQRSRSKSDSLQVHPDAEGNPSIIYSRDPDGGGTWLGTAVNTGIVVALLNNYSEGVSNFRGKRSRGLLVKDLLGISSVQEIKATVVDETSWTLSDYGSFHLLVFGLKDSFSLSWDGYSLNENPLEQYSFISTSSVDPKRIIPLRKSSCEQASVKGFAEVRKLFLKPTNSAEGICMDREDARTVSFTEIDLNPQKLIHAFRRRETQGTGFEAPMELSVKR